MLRLFYLICLGDKGCQEDAKAWWESQAMLGRCQVVSWKHWGTLDFFFKWWVCWEDIRGWWGVKQCQEMLRDIGQHWVASSLPAKIYSFLKKCFYIVCYHTGMQFKKSGDSKKFWNLATRKRQKHFLFAIFSQKTNHHSGETWS